MTALRCCSFVPDAAIIAQSRYDLKAQLNRLRTLLHARLIKCRASAVYIGEPNPPFAMKFTKRLDLFLLVLDDFQLMMIGQSSQRDQKQLSGKYVHGSDCTTV